jgi:hypothetical protein
MPLSQKEIEAPRHKIKNALHWGEIRDEAKLKNTIWSELIEDQLVQDKRLDVHKFEELFCVNPEDERLKRRSSFKAEKEPINMYSMWLFGFIVICLEKIYGFWTQGEETTLGLACQDFTSV